MSKLETNTIDTISGSTNLTLGGTNATDITIPSGVTITNNGTQTGFGLSGWSEDGANNNLLPASSSAGIYLGTTSATASNLLDDYEEGTWTPTVVGSTTAGSTSGGDFNGDYVKIGNTVILSWDIQNVTTSSMVGNLRIGNLPFTPSFSGGGGARRIAHGSCGFYNVEFSSHGTVPITRVNESTADIGFNALNSNSTWGTIDVDNGTGQYYTGQVIYTTA